MKVGTDGVLLGAWCHLPLADTSQDTRALDVGTGSGLIALMLAQRFPHTNVDAIDIDEASLGQAHENVEASPFSTRIHLLKMDFRNINQNFNKYDLIVSNPPFYKEDTLSGIAARDAARHTTSLPFETLIEHASELLTDKGLFSVIVPTGETSEFVSLCAFNKLYLKRRTDVRSSDRKPFKRTLLEFGKSIQASEMSTLTLQDAPNQRSPEYHELTKNFYI